MARVVNPDEGKTLRCKECGFTCRWFRGWAFCNSCHGSGAKLAAYHNLELVEDRPEGVADQSDCDCMIPYLEGAGQHAPGCSVFK